MKILLSIKPEYTEKIFSGEKKFEFRKSKPKKLVKKVFIYESHPSKYIAGWFTIKKVISGSPKVIWNKCKKQGGIDEENYFAYCSDKKIIHALEIDFYHQYDSPINPFNMISDFKPPQNFLYIEQSIMLDKLED